MADAKLPITPAKLATRALTGYPTALRWLKIHHPELLVPKADTQEGPKTTSQAKTAPETFRDPLQGDHSSPKAKKPARRLRNPENEPF